MPASLPRLGRCLIMLPLLVVLFFAACDASAGTSSPHVTAVPLSQLLKLNSAASDNVAGLHVQLSGLMNDGTPYSENAGFDCGGVLVLSSTKLAYSATDVQHVRSYVGAYNQTQGIQATVYEPIPPSNARGLPPIPSTLEWVQGDPQARICKGQLQMTNTGKSSVVVERIGVQLSQAPLANSFQYRLVDRCSMVRCTPGGGAMGPCVYEADLRLGAGAKGTTFDSQIAAEGPPIGAPCPLPLRLAPGQTANITITITPSGSSNMIYGITPFARVAAGGSEHTITFPHLTNTASFSSRSQFSCYTLKGTTFTAVPSANWRFPFACM